MKLIKLSNYAQSNLFNPNDQFVDIDKDLRNIITFSQGRVRFGSGVDGERGENISGEFHTFTSSATANETNTILHTMTSTPIGWLTVSSDKGGILYLSTKNNLDIRLISTTTSTIYTIFLLK